MRCFRCENWWKCCNSPFEVRKRLLKQLFKSYFDEQLDHLLKLHQTSLNWTYWAQFSPPAFVLVSAFVKTNTAKETTVGCVLCNKHCSLEINSNKFVAHRLSATWFHSPPERKRMSAGEGARSSHQHTAANTFAPVGRAARGDAYIMGHLRQKLITLRVCHSLTHSSSPRCFADVHVIGFSAARFRKS